MVLLYRKERTIDAINKLSVVQEHRPYLGMSQLGHSCERYLWYSFRWCYTETIPARVVRLFARGHREEEVIFDSLKEVGIKVYNKQKEIIAVHGHVRGHIDGECTGVIEAPKTPHLAECKTMHDKNFKKALKEGITGFPTYWAQAQLYMRSLKLTRCLFVCVNKNDDDMYIERINADDYTYEVMIDKAERVILSEQPPEKKFAPTWYECKWCSANKVCHGGEPVDKNCRTCKNCDLAPAGKWLCNADNDRLLSVKEQRKGCDKWQSLL